MKNVTVKSLAEEIQISVDYLLQQFSDMGIAKTERDFVTQQEKETLLTYLNCSYSVVPNKLILRRKTRSTLNILGTGGKSKSVQIEVRKKRTYVQHNLKFQEKIQEEPIQHTQRISEKKTKHVIFRKEKYAIAEGDKPSKQTKTLMNSLETESQKSHHENDLSKIKKKEIKVKEKTSSITEKTNHINIEKNNWNDILVGQIEEQSTNHSSNLHHIRRALESENKHREENECRQDHRSSKIIKRKNINRLSAYGFDSEENIISRGKKSKRQSTKLSILTQSFKKPVQAISRDVIIGETITVAELANKMAIKGSQVIKAMMKLGAMATINQIIDQETAQLVVEEMGHKVILHRENALEELVMLDQSASGSFVVAELRAPVVTIMGHADHGKTSLLDYIRSTKVAAREAGGITQHIGAYCVKNNNGMITFLDTPGHAAFTAMRARGAQATDIVVLVVAADDGVMPQTIEAIQHAKAAQVPVVVAISKIDKPEADPNRIQHELIQHGIIPEKLGGESQFVYVSSKSGDGIDDLLDAILLQAEILELKAIRSGIAHGVVIESFLDKGRGPIATVLVREGTLNRGDIVLCGSEYGRIRAMKNEVGNDVNSAGPSMPIEILGLSGVPFAGDKVTVVRDEKKAREVALYRQGKFREVKLSRQKKSNSQNIFTNITGEKTFELNIVLKSDVQGSSEAIRNALENLSTNEIKVNIVGSGVGSITETDAILAAASNAILLGFNVRDDIAARKVIKDGNLNLFCYSVIYDLIDEVKKIMSSMLIPEYKKEIIGLAEVRNVFHSTKFGVIAGCMVTEGVIKRHKKIHVLRKNMVIYEGELESLRRFKDDTDIARNGTECGIGIKNCNDICVGDVIEMFENVKIQRSPVQ